MHLMKQSSLGGLAQTEWFPLKQVFPKEAKYLCSYMKTHKKLIIKLCLRVCMFYFLKFFLHAFIKDVSILMYIILSPYLGHMLKMPVFLQTCCSYLCFSVI